MASRTRVDLHCHSRHSDGKLRPEELADHMAAQGVAVAALTDHDTVEGQVAFRRALARRSIGWFSGLEVTSFHRGREVHLLAYGFDLEHPELVAALASIRKAREQPIASIVDDLRTRGNRAEYPTSVDSAGRLTTQEAIGLVHRAGGKVFLAHPITTERDSAKLLSLVQELKALGLDGIEALYAGYAPEEHERLLAIARDQELLTSAGTDLHEPPDPRAPGGIEMPTDQWKAFRDAVAQGPRGGAAPAPAQRSSPGGRWGRFAFHIMLPTVLAIALFAGAIWGFVLPTFEKSLLDRKREMIRELTHSAWSVLANAHGAEVSGELSREEAQRLAASRIETLRYGREGKDYFWVQDTTPRMIMHPYRQDLNQQDLSRETDARGVRIFVEFAEIVRRRGEGYVEYVWQWKDDPRRIAPKESYVKGFEPWNWIIGTGIYTDDVHQEIARVERGLVYGSLAIIGTVAALLLYVMRESMHLEKERSEAEEHLHESHQRYESLVEASTEGALLTMQGRCQYANPVLLKLLGRSSHEVELLDLDDVLPQSEQNAEARRDIGRALAGEEVTGGVEAQLQRADGTLVDCVLSLSPIRVGEKSGLVLLVKDMTARLRLRAAGLAAEVTVRWEDAEQLRARIESADTAEQVIRQCLEAPELTERWLSAGFHARHVAATLAEVCDAASFRFIGLAQRQLGPAPVPFAFLAMGSQGRQEQTLYTDQDNMIVLADEADEASARPYFTDLGRRVCASLNDAGYALCRGQVMAQNEKWCRPLAFWKQNFAHWIARAEPKELLELCIFFDLRTVYGPPQLEESLRQGIAAALAEAPGFYPHFAQNSLLFKPPMRLFGHILATGEQPGQLDLKHAMMPIVNFARLYALKHGLRQTGTLPRLAAMAENGLLAETTRQDLSYAYEFLLRLRLEHQVERLRSGQPADNSIQLQQLSHTEQVLLKEAFSAIDAVQKKVTYDFLGGIS